MFTLASSERGLFSLLEVEILLVYHMTPRVQLFLHSLQKGLLLTLNRCMQSVIKCVETI